MNTSGQCVKTECGISSPECLSSVPFLDSVRVHFVFAQHEIAPGVLMVLVVGSYRWFGWLYAKESAPISSFSPAVLLYTKRLSRL